MENLKTLGKILLVLLGLVILAVLGVAFFPAAAYEPPTRDLRDESSFRLDERTGWYRLEDGSPRLLTYGAENGLVLYGFGADRDALRRTAFTPHDAETLVAANPNSASRLEFLNGTDDAPAKTRLTNSKGVTQDIARMTDPAYTSREVRFANGTIELAGLLLAPSGPGPHPAVVFIHGSGQSDRDAFWYLSPADYFARQGIVVLLPDKRGCGKSGGAWHTSSFDDFAGDALAGVALLREHPLVDQKSIGLVGFSQGGWIAPLAAARSKDVGFVITVSGSAASPSEQLVYEMRNEVAGSGAPRFVAGMLAPLLARRAKMPRPEWWEQNGRFDPLASWQAVTVSSLMIFGRQDENVDVQRSLARLGEAGLLNRPNFNTRVFDEFSHAMIREDTGWLDAAYLECLGQFVEQAKVD